MVRPVSVEPVAAAPVELVELLAAPKVPVPEVLVLRSGVLDELLGEIAVEELVPGVLLAIVSPERVVSVEALPVLLVEALPASEPVALVVSVCELVELGLLEVELRLGLAEEEVSALP